MQDLSSDVTALSTKLIEAIEAQSNLEDQIQSMRRELESCRKENQTLQHKCENEMVDKTLYNEQVEQRQHSEKRASELQAEIEELTGSLFDEANKMVADAKRDTAVWAKRNSQLQLQLQEKDTLLENMQQQLSGLKSVLQDMTDQEERAATPTLSGNSQSDFGSSNSALQHKTSSSMVGDDTTTNNNNSSSSSSSIASGAVGGNNYFIHHSEDYSLSSLVRPLIRTDLASFADFKSLAQNINHVYSTSNTATTVVEQSSNVSSPRKSTSIEAIERNGDSSTLSGGTKSNPGSPRQSTPTSATNRYSLNFGSYSSISNSNNNNNNSTNNNASTPIQYHAPSLKEFRFFKRVLADDIDPTLRLDLSPGLSWLARRTVMSSIIEGTAVVEPISGVNEGYKYIVGGSLASERRSAAGTDRNGHLYAYPQGGPPVATKAPCKVCGENRDSSLLYARMHNLRIDKSSAGNSSSTSTANGVTPTHSASNSTSGSSGVGQSAEKTSSNNDDSGLSAASALGKAISFKHNSEETVSTGHPLCYYCLNRVRTVCDFVSFMRSIRDGVWKVDDEQSQNRAWEECIRLRERMFWARIGGSFPWGPYEAPQANNHNNNNHNAQTGLAVDTHDGSKTPSGSINETTITNDDGNENEHSEPDQKLNEPDQELDDQKDLEQGDLQKRHDEHESGEKDKQDDEGNEQAKDESNFGDNTINASTASSPSSDDAEFVDTHQFEGEDAVKTTELRTVEKQDAQGTANTPELDTATQ